MSAAELEDLYCRPISPHYGEQQNQQQTYHKYQQETQDPAQIDDQISPTIDFGAIAPSNNINLVRGVSTLAGLDGFIGMNQSMQDLDSLLGDSDGVSLRESFLQPQFGAPITQQKQKQNSSVLRLVEIEGSSLDKDFQPTAAPRSQLASTPITAQGPPCTSIATASKNSVGGATGSRVATASATVAAGKGRVISPCQSEKNATAIKKNQNLKMKLMGSSLGKNSSPEIEIQYKRHLEKLRRKMKQSDESRALVQCFKHSLLRGGVDGNPFRDPVACLPQAVNPMTRTITRTESDLVDKSNPSSFDPYYDISVRRVLQESLMTFSDSREEVRGQTAETAVPTDDNNNRNENNKSDNTKNSTLPSPLLDTPLLPSHTDDGHMDLEKFRRSETRSIELNAFERRPSWVVFRSSSHGDRRKRASVMQNEPFLPPTTNENDMNMAQAAALVAASYDNDDDEEAFLDAVGSGSWEFLGDNDM